MRHWAEDQITLALIRHGGTAANYEHRYLGRTDEPLSPRGRAALLSYREQGCYPQVQYLFSGSMKRCLETGRILYPKLTPLVIPEWVEIDFGQFENKNYGELKNDRRYQAWIDSGGTLAFPRGESREDFVQRCKRGFGRMCRELSRRIADNMALCEAAVFVGAIVHGGTIMALLNAYGGMDYFDTQAANGKGYLCRVRGWRQESIRQKDGAEENSEGFETEAVQIEVIKEI